MEYFWTSRKPINGLRHFVLVNEMKEKGDINFLMVSVIDSEISLEITHEELVNSGNWFKGWINLPKVKSITKEYVRLKSLNNKKLISKIFLTDDSVFNIS